MELTPAQAEKEWECGRFKPVYLLLGDDDSAKASTLKRLKDLLRLDPFNQDEYGADANSMIATIVSSALTPPLMAARRLVIVKHPKLGVEARRKLAEYLREPMETTTLVLFSEDRRPDLRDVVTAAVAALEGIVLFKPLRPQEAQERLIAAAQDVGRTLEGETAELIVSEVGANWNVLSAELEKMILLTRGKNAIRREDALACLGYRQTASPFDLPRTIQAKDAAASLKLLKRLRDEGEEPLRILYQITYTLNKQLRGRRMHEAKIPQEQIFKELRLQSYYDRDFLKLALQVSPSRLVASLKACLRLETALKSETWLDGWTELERLVADICGGAVKAVGRASPDRSGNA